MNKYAAICLLMAFFLNVFDMSAVSRLNIKLKVEELTIEELQDAFKSGQLTISEVVSIYLERIDSFDVHGPKLNSVITVNPDALLIANELDAQLKKSKNIGPLFGVPVIIKDNIDTHDKMPCTAGSRALANSLPADDSFLVKKLRQAGAVILGKANLSEWANFRGQLSTSGWSGVGGQTLNPYQLDRNPCGSSSGSAVAVSANLCMIAIGTETNGSIVCPSHINGIVGIKPTVGLISRTGIIPISFTQDTPGPMARTLTDAVKCLGLLTEIDSADSKTLLSKGNSFADYTPFLKKEGLNRKRIGVLTSSNGIHYKVDTLMSKAVELMKSQGAEIIYINQISDPLVDSLSFEIMLNEYKDGLNAYFKSLGANAPVKNISELIEFNKKDSIELNYFDQLYLEMAVKKEGIDSENYQSALKKMLFESRENGIDKVMSENSLDAIVAPTGSPAWKTDLINGDHYQFGTSSPAAIAGYPNITIPMGFIEQLPVGISFFGKAWSEPTLIEIAYGFESATHARRAPQFLK